MPAGAPGRRMARRAHGWGPLATRPTWRRRAHSNPASGQNRRALRAIPPQVRTASSYVGRAAWIESNSSQRSIQRCVRSNISWV
jgi:hypothetical protein